MRLGNLCLSFVMLALLAGGVQAQLLGDPPDVSVDFQKMDNVYFVGSKVNSFDAATGGPLRRPG